MENEKKLPVFLGLPMLQGGDPVSAALHFRAMELQSDGMLRDWYREAAQAARTDSDRRTVDEAVERILTKSFSDNTPA